MHLHSRRLASSMAAPAYSRALSNSLIPDPGPPLASSHTGWSTGGGLISTTWHAGQAVRSMCTIFSRFSLYSSIGTCCFDDGTAESFAPKKTVTNIGSQLVCAMRYGSCSKAHLPSEGKRSARSGHQHSSDELRARVPAGIHAPRIVSRVATIQDISDTIACRVGLL